MVWGSARIWIASIVLLFQKPRAVPWTHAPSQSMLWLVVRACTAIPFFSSPFFTACLCLLIYSDLQCSLGLSNVRIPYGNPYRELGRPLPPSSLQVSFASLSPVAASVYSGA